MKKLNIKLSDRVVCYETGATHLFHTRAAWMLKAMGHPNVQVLDGGFAKWVAEGKPVCSPDDQAKEEDFDYKMKDGFLTTFEDVKAFEGEPGNRLLLDCRQPAQFEKESIPNSQNVVLGILLNEDKT